MAENSSSSSAIVVAAAILGLAVVGASQLLRSSFDARSARLEDLLAQLRTGGEKLADAPGARRARAPRPDPSDPGSDAGSDARRVYEVAIGDAPRRGSAEAEVQIVEWADFQCPFCRRATPTLARIEREYGDRVAVSFKHMPLSMHPKALPAHRAAEAAARQGHFWEMHDKIFANPGDLSREAYLRYAGELGLDLDRFQRDMDSPEVQSRIDADVAQANALGVTGTPAFFVNGQLVSGAQPFSSFKLLIDQQLKKN